MPLLTTLAEHIKSADSLQGILVGTGVAVITAAASRYGKSKPARIGMTILGLVLIVAPFTLPAPKLFSAQIPGTLSGGGWHTYDVHGYGSDLRVTMDESGSIEGVLETKSCPVGPQCASTIYPINGSYNKENGQLILNRSNPDSRNPLTKYYATFDSPYFARGSIVETGDTSTFVIYQSY